MSIYINARFLTQPVSGVQRYALECSRKIKKIYPKTIFLSPPDLYNRDAAAELGVVIVGKRTGHRWEQTDLPRYLRKLGSPPLFNPCNTAPLFYSNNYITLHDLAFKHHPGWNSLAFSWWYNFIIPRIVKRSRHLFTVSETIRKEIIENYNVSASHISVTYNGVSERMQMETALATKEKIILSVGSFNLRKNHHLLIKAFIASKLAGEYQLIIVGEKNKVFSETGIDADAARSANIIIHNTFDENNLIATYRKAAIIVSLSAYEGFGIPILEGLYFGCRAVCSDIATYRELYNDAAIFCDPGDTASVCDALEKAVATTKQTDTEKLLSMYNYAASATKIVSTITQHI